jgi:uncharacterized membrane protein YfcA
VAQKVARNPWRIILDLVPLGTGIGPVALVLGAGFFAGFIDSIVGGGGLIQVPALLAAYPTAPPADLLGTNKLGSICGVSSATLRYTRVVSLPWRRLWPALCAAFLAALLGATLVSHVSPTVFRPLVPFMLCALLVYVLWNKELGSRHAPQELQGLRLFTAFSAVGAIGFYDGFFGPGTGSFLMLLFIRIYGFDFLHASAAARAVNVATNGGALLLFALQGQVHWGFGLSLGVSNALGSVLGAHTAIKHGSKFVRAIYIVVVVSLIAKTAFDATHKV